jgi:hypothetical protein
VLRVLAGLIGVALALTAMAYAATAPHGRGVVDRGAGTGSSGGGPAPVILRHPARTTLSTRARFRFSGPPRTVRFECGLDGAGWTACSSPVSFRSLERSSHSFRVRAVERGGRRSSAARYRWTVVEPKAFTIAPRLSDLSTLFPGSPAAALPLRLTNPNPVAIAVIRLSVAVRSDPRGCDSAQNLELTPSSASSSHPLRIPAGGSVRVPSQGVLAPTIRLRNLPVNQDACQDAQFPLAFSGVAR